MIISAVMAPTNSPRSSCTGLKKTVFFEQGRLVNEIRVVDEELGHIEEVDLGWDGDGYPISVLTCHCRLED